MNKNIFRILFIVCLFCLLNSIGVYADWYKGDDTGYSVNSGARINNGGGNDNTKDLSNGMKMNLKIHRTIGANGLGVYNGGDRLTVSIVDGEGNDVSNVSVLYYEAGTSTFVYGMVTGANGDVWADLDNGYTYDIIIPGWQGVYGVSTPNTISLTHYAEWGRGDDTGYDADTGAGMKMNVRISKTNSSKSVGVYDGSNNLTVKIVDSDGDIIPNASVVFYVAGNSTFVYGATTDENGLVWARLGNSNEYDIITTNSDNMYGVAAPNFVILQNFTGNETNVTINVVNSSGVGINNTKVSVYNNGTSNIACQANTSSSGEVKCELNSSRYVDVVTDFGVNMYNLNISSNPNVTLLYYAESISLNNLTVNMVDNNGMAVVNKKVSVYENGTSVKACEGNTSSSGQIKCELNSSRYVDVVTDFGANMYGLNVSSNQEITLLRYSESLPLVNFTPKLIDLSGNAVVNKKITVYNNGTRNYSKYNFNDTSITAPIVNKTLSYNDTSVTTPIVNNTLVDLSNSNITSVNSVINATGSGSDELPSECYTINTTYGQFIYTNVSESCDHIGDLHILYDYNTSPIYLSPDLISPESDFNITSVNSVINATGSGSDELPSECYTINTTTGQFIYTNVSESCDHIGDLHILYDYEEYPPPSRWRWNVPICSGNTSSDGTIKCELNSSRLVDVVTDFGVNMYNLNASKEATLTRYSSLTELDNMTVTVINGSTSAVMPNQEVTIQINGTSTELCKGNTSSGGTIKCELNNSEYVSVVTDWWVSPMNLTGLNVTENESVDLVIGYGLGVSCISSGVCISGYCTDGVCCNSDCGGTCGNCGTGTCSPAFANCGYCDACNGTTTAGYNCTGSVNDSNPLCDTLLNITLIDNDGDAVITEKVNVSINSTPANLSCSSKPFSDGMFICGVDSSNYYDVHVPSGANYTNVSVPNEFRLKDRATPQTINFSKLNITWLDSEGNVIVGRRLNVSETSPEGRRSDRDCTGDTNSQGGLYCGLAENNTYDIMYNHSVFNATHIVRGISFNSDASQVINELNATLNITLIDNEGDGVAGQEINVTEVGSDNISCFGDTDVNGVFICGLNASNTYDVRIQSGANYTNVTPSEFRVKNISTRTINFSKLTVTWYNQSGGLVVGQRLNVSETSPEGRRSDRDCTGDTNSQGKLYCGLAENNTYDIMYNHSVFNATHIVRGISFNSDVNQIINELNATLNITLIDNDGSGVAGKEVNVTDVGTDNISCFGDTDVNGVFICGLNASNTYDVRIQSGANYTNVTPSEFRVKNVSTQTINFSKLNTTWLDSEGNVIVGQRLNVSETSTEGRRSDRDCTGYTNSNGEMYCGLAENSTYDIMYNHSVFNTRHVIRGIDLNSDVNQIINEWNATLNITLIDNDGNGVAGQEINVTDYGTDNISCFGDTDANGVFVCGLNASKSYDVHVPSGANYSNVSFSSPVRLKDLAAQTINFSRLNITWLDSEGNAVVGQRLNVSETSPGGRRNTRDCTGVTDSNGKLYCGLSVNNTYDVMYNHSVFNTWHVIRGVGFSSDVSQSLIEGNASLNITLKDNNGDVVANQPINVTQYGSNNVSCFGDTGANGVFVCALNSSFTYNVNVPSYANYTNVSLPNEFILEDRATPASITFSKLVVTIRDSYGTIIVGERVDVYERGTTYLACRGDTNDVGQIYCGLDKDKTYDVMSFNVSTVSGISNATVKSDISGTTNVSVSPIVSDVIVAAPPTIVTLQGKLTDTSGATVGTGSMYVQIFREGSESAEWSSTFNNVLDEGVFNIGLGTLNAMYLTRDERHRIIVSIDIDATTYSTADVTFGDNNPSNDLIKFVPG